MAGAISQQTGAHGVLGAAQQVAQILDRKIEPEAEDLDQFVVPVGAGDDAGVAGFRKMRAGIVRKAADHLAVAAVDDHVGDFLGKVGPPGDREQVILSLGAGNLDQRVGGDPARMRQHFAGNRDLVVAGQMLDDLEGCIVERRQPLAEFGLGPRFDARDQQAEDVVEDLDLVVAQALAIIEEQIGHLPQGFDPTGR